MFQLQQSEPFKMIFKYFKYFGMWTSISVQHRVLSFIAFLLLNLSCCILIILSLILNARNIEEFTRCTIYGSVYLISLSCVINFNTKRNEIQDFIEDLNQVINHGDKVMNDFIENGLRKCNRMFNITYRKSVVNIATGTVVVPLIFREVEIPILIPSYS